MSKIPDWVWQTLSIMVVPLIAWGISLEVGNAAQSTRIEDLISYKAEAKIKIENLQLQVQTHTEQITRITEIKSDLKDLQKTIESNNKDIAKAIEANGKDIVAVSVKLQAVDTALGDVVKALKGK